eukprot:1639226-Rhodomonas_salina.2
MSAQSTQAQRAQRQNHARETTVSVRKSKFRASCFFRVSCWLRSAADDDEGTSDRRRAPPAGRDPPGRSRTSASSQMTYASSQMTYASSQMTCAKECEERALATSCLATTLPREYDLCVLSAACSRGPVPDHLPVLLAVVVGAVVPAVPEMERVSGERVSGERARAERVNAERK